jgi:sarcosine/dimethylglycine N-methyltransferase
MKPIVKSSSRPDLLNLPVLSSSQTVSDFVIDGVGGGYIVVNTYGDYNLSIARLDMGVLGEDSKCSGWVNEEDALDHVFSVSACQAEKCTAADLKGGGAGVLVFVYNRALNTEENRKALLTLAAENMAKLTNTSILCMKGIGTTTTDLRALREASCVKPEAEAKTPEDSTVRNRSRSWSDTKYDCPVPMPMLETTDDVITKCGSYSAFGAINCLIAAKKWQKPIITILGITDVSAELYWLLTKKGYGVSISSSDPADVTKHKIPSDRAIPWNENLLRTTTDILLLCCPSFCESLTKQRVEELRCSALLSLHDSVLPSNSEEKELVLSELDRAGIFDFCEGLVDLGSLMKAYSMSGSSVSTGTYKPADAANVGMVLMQKMLHLDGIVKQYDPEEKQKFFEELMNKGKRLADDHPIQGIWDGVNISEIAVGVASTQMTEWMWNKAKGMCPAYRLKKKGSVVNYLDLGAGEGEAARWICKQDADIHIKCINISRAQNAKNRELSDEEGLGGQVTVETGTFERMDPEYSNLYDGCMSQNSFVHAFNRLHAFTEAYKVTKGGGWLLVSDLTCGEEEDISKEEDFDTQNVTKWVTTSQSLDMARQAGWAEVQFVDMTDKIKTSCQAMIQKIKILTADTTENSESYNNSLTSWRANLSKRIGQIDRGVFKWGIVAGRKPYNVVFFQRPPVVPQANEMIKYTRHEEDGCLKFGTDVVVLTIKDHMNAESIENLPPTTRLLVTMSAGLDHVDIVAAKKRGIAVTQAARDTITKSVADYLMCCMMFGLRGGFENIGVPFPGKAWDLSWNAQGVDLDKAKIGFIGMGAIAAETVRRIRQLSTECTLVYNIPAGLRSNFVEGTHRMVHVGIADLYR